VCSAALFESKTVPKLCQGNGILGFFPLSVSNWKTGKLLNLNCGKIVRLPPGPRIGANYVRCPVLKFRQTSGKALHKKYGGQTAQSTGAFGYMCHAEAKEFAEIYDTQEEFDLAQHQAA
jgi:hypothetical protein